MKISVLKFWVILNISMALKYIGHLKAYLYAKENSIWIFCREQVYRHLNQHQHQLTPIITYILNQTFSF